MKDTYGLPPILNVSDIKAFLNIGERQAYELVKSRQFHSVKTSERRIKVSRASFLSWLNGQNVST